MVARIVDFEAFNDDDAFIVDITLHEIVAASAVRYWIVGSKES